MQPRFTGRRTRGSRFGMVAALLGALLLATLSAMAVGAASVTVTTTMDRTNTCATDGMTAPCSLRDAISYANTHSGTTITLPANIDPYALSSHIDIKANMTINGGGASTTVINDSASERIFTVFLGDMVTLNNLTLSNGNDTLGGGGAIQSGGYTTLNTCIVDRNTSTTNGGGIYVASGSLTLNSTVVSNNNAVGNGGGVYGNGGSITVTSSQFTTNHATGNPGTLGFLGYLDPGGDGGRGGDAVGGQSMRSPPSRSRGVALRGILRPAAAAATAAPHLAPMAATAVTAATDWVAPLPVAAARSR